MTILMNHRVNLSALWNLIVKTNDENEANDITSHLILKIIVLSNLADFEIFDRLLQIYGPLQMETIVTGQKRTVSSRRTLGDVDCKFTVHEMA